VSEKIANRLVLDSHAVLALLETGAIGERAAGLIQESEPWMTLVNLGEVAYIIERRQGKDAADRVFARLLAPEPLVGGVSMTWMPVDPALVRRAASLKAGGGLSYADCFAAAAAALLQCPVLTGDPEFRKVEEAGIEVLWLDAGSAQSNAH
jgi:PIN domain nuclease of toxin-antitoxin system